MYFMQTASGCMHLLVGNFKDNSFRKYMTRPTQDTLDSNGRSMIRNGPLYT